MALFEQPGVIIRVSLFDFPFRVHHKRSVGHEAFIEYLDLGASSASTATEKTVRGYKVRVVSEAISEREAEAKREAIAEVIAKSMLRGKE